MINTFFSRLRRRLFGLNAIQARFDILQSKLDAVAFSVNKIDISRDQERFDILQRKLDQIEASVEPYKASVEVTSSSQITEPTSSGSTDVATEEETRGKGFRLPAYLEAVVQSDRTSRAVPALNSNEAVRVLFVAQYPSVWSSWRSVWHAMDKDPRFVATVVLTPFIHPFSSTAVTFDEMRKCLIDENVPFCTVDFFDIDEFRPHIVFLQNPYDETRPKFLRSDELTEIGVRVAYIPYGLEMGGGAWNIAAQFDSPLHRTAWRIFARSDRHKKMFAHYCRAGNAHVVATGHPKFDSVRVNSRTTLPGEITAKIAGRNVILWTPHFSVGDTPTWSTYRLYGEYILSEIHRWPNLFLLLRPHPLFFKAMRQHGVWDAEGERKFRQSIDDSQNMALEESPDYNAAFSASDALMTDVGSFLLEYLPTKKPLLYLHHPNGLGMNDDAELVNALYVASDPQEIKRFFQMVSIGDDPRKYQRELALPEFLSGLGSNIGENICQHIYSSFTVGDAWFPRITKQSSILQQGSEAYWKNSNFTYLAPPDYYEAKEMVLNETLQRLPSIEKAIDIGCGDGKFTFQLAEYAKELSAYDISPALIEKARETAATLGVVNITFSVQELGAIAPFDKYDLVACLGVTSCIIDDVKFLYFLDKLKALSRQGAYLLLIDTLSTGSEQNVADQNGYIAKYRVIDDYRNLIERRGFILREEILIKEVAEKKVVNKLFVLQFDCPNPEQRVLGQPCQE